MLKWKWLLLALAIALVVTGIKFQGVASAQDSTPDHSLFAQLAGPFTNPQDVTATCLTCHPNAAKEVMGTIHWTWEHKDSVTGQMVGKKNLINNYAMALPSNEPRCASCHAGYGYQDKTFDFSTANANNVDCLVCHAKTDLYKKFPAGAGYPVLGQDALEFPIGSGQMWSPVDLARAAQSVGKPTRDNCGSCHFSNASDDILRHADLNSSLSAPAREQDVHMSPGALNFDCVSCHQPDAHQMPGMVYNGEPRLQCDSCHSATPHKEPNVVLNKHTDVVACQTCHIPAYARGEAVRTSLDWSTAGDHDASGKPVVKKDDAGRIIYDGQMGAFSFAENIRPVYMWWNGQTGFLSVNDKIEPGKTVRMTDYKGARGDGKIYPFQRFTGKQPYDSGNNTFVIPNLFSNNTNDTDAYWKSYDWNRAIASGMSYAGANYSGQYGWVETEYYQVQNHEVAPKEGAVQCQECHVAQGGRLDFAALGYSEAEVAGLTQFPPALQQTAPTSAPTLEPTAAPTLEPTQAPTVIVPTVPATPVPEVATAQNGVSALLLAIAAIVLIAGAAYFIFKRVF